MRHSFNMPTVVGVAVGLLVVFAAVGGAQELRGQGQWQSLSGDEIKGKWQTMLVRHGDAVAGTISLTGSSAFKQAAVSGSITPQSIVLGTVQQDEKAASFSATLDGNKINGEWESTVVGDHGVWSGTLSGIATQ
jgi:hypothetical protein